MFKVQRIYKGMDDGRKIYDWCIVDEDTDTVVLRLDTRMDCKDVVGLLNELKSERDSLATGFDEYQSHVAEVLGEVYGKYGYESIVEEICKKLNIEVKMK